MQHTHREYAFILDRDGTIIRDKHYLADPAGVELLSFAAEGLRLVQRHNMRIFVVTNQSGIGRGYYSVDAMHAVNARMEALLAAQGVYLDGVYYCPHAPQENCTCRKPALGMIEQIYANASLNAPLDPAHCYVVGDKECDVALGHAACMRSVLVRTGYGLREQSTCSVPAHFIADNLLAAAQWAVQCESRNVLT